jgi:3-deoxy-D-manno-octulosonic-acid transferase
VPETSASYRALATIASSLLRLSRPLSAKLAAGDRGRREALARWLGWARAHRDDRRPLLWVHAPSVGEGLQAEEVIRLLRAQHSEWQLCYSYFSPSAIALANRLPVDYADYLPYDTRPDAETLVAALRPTALVFTKLDLWPELATRADRQGVRVGMIAATVSPVSGRLHPLARRLTRPGYAALRRVGAIDQPDAGRLIALGVAPTRITVTGDPRFDSAARRAAAVARDDPSARLTAGAPTVVAGSTWGRDEAVLLAAFAAVRESRPEARLILVPHEPTPARLARVERRVADHHLSSRRLSDLTAGAVADLVIVDRVGLLAGLYAGAVFGYVGGGLGGAGLHSVLEPAAFGVPVVFGPRWQSSREAGLLIAARGAHALASAGAAAAAELAGLWLQWLSDPAEPAERGRRAQAVITRELGAAERSAQLVTQLMTE